MRINLALLMALIVSLGTGCGREDAAPQASAKPSAPASAPIVPKPEADVLAQVHFVGTTQLLADKKATAKLNEIAAMPETTALRDETLTKLATAPYRFLREREKLDGQALDEAALIRPLLEDLIPNESYVELRGPTNPVPDLLLAVHLGKERAALWQTNLSTILQNWTGITASNLEAEGYSGWELKKHHPPNVIRFIRAGDWAVFAWGQDEIPALPGWLQKIKADGRPAAVMQDHWLEAWADWPRLLRQETAASVPFKLPTMQLGLSMKDDNVRTKAVLQFPEPLNLTLPEWKFPTNLIHNPIVNFTAVRGVAPWLSRIDFFKQLQLDPMPDQFCSWAMYGAPFETYFATPVAQGTNFVQQLGTRLIEVENPKLIDKNWGHLAWDEKHTTVNWTGIFPAVAPYLTPASGTNGDFVLAGLFPRLPRSGKVPPELFAQILGHTNQVYYDWEITGERVGQWWNLMMLHHLLRGEYFTGANAPAQKWLAAIGSRVGNAATEVTVTGTHELTVIRKSPLGLMSFELGYGLAWEMAAGFPLQNEFPRAPKTRTRLNGSQPTPVIAQPGAAQPVVPATPK